MKLPEGLYDALVTESSARLLSDLLDPSCRTLSDLYPEEAAERLSEALSNPSLSSVGTRNRRIIL